MTFSTMIRAGLGAIAIFAFGACSPVSNSISKFGPETHTRDEQTVFAQLTVIPKTKVVPEARFLSALQSLPDGVKVDAINSKQFDEFSVKGSTEIEIPGTSSANVVELYAILELAVNPHVADQSKMDKVELQFVKKDLNRFLISISREAGDENSRKYVRGLLSRISVGHRVVD